MTRYYVYHIKDHEDPERGMRAFVHDPAEFAAQAFDPATMEFSGVFIEAANSDEAHRIYMRPQAEDVFVSCNEPRFTALKREAFESRLRLVANKLHDLKKMVDKAENATRRLRTQTLILEISNDFNQLATRISELSRIIRVTTADEKVSDEEVYVQLMERYAKQFANLKYRPSIGGTSEG